jgi:hypothetical protein
MGLIRGGVPTELAIVLKDAYNICKVLLKLALTAVQRPCGLHLRDGSQPRHLQAQ